MLQINNVTFKYSTGETLLENISETILPKDKIALVGPNGSGKSTLFKLIAGILEPSSGNIQSSAIVKYIQQIDLNLNKNNEKLYKYLEKNHDEWWKILITAKQLFNTDINPEQTLNSLSGGEMMKLNISTALAYNPGILLLDEPTNHLDIISLKILNDFLLGFSGAYIIISHDHFFLNNVVTKVWEISNKKIKSYGGNYFDFQSQKQLQLEAKKRKFLDAKEQIKHIKTLEQKELQRSARSANIRKKAYYKGSLDSFGYVGGERGKPSPSTSHITKIKKLRAEALKTINENETEFRRMAFIKIDNTDAKSSHTLFNLVDAQLNIGEKMLATGINFSLKSGERISIGGKNGSGKTSFIKALLGLGPAKLHGKLYQSPNLQYIYIDQNYSLINPHLNLVENVMAANNEISDGKAREQLGRVQFKNEAELLRPAGVLSGGEMARLALAMLTTKSIDLLILDEPTNNLDTDTIEVLIKALNNFKCGLIIISHNTDFLNRIKIQKSYIIEHQRLKL